MKKGKLLAVALIGVLLAVGLVLASCGPPCPGDGSCEIKIRDNGSGGAEIVTSKDPCGEDSCAGYKLSRDFYAASNDEQKELIGKSAKCNCN